ncbi:MAG TPA: biotin/lipoyl-binding protein, partial [Pyrinomonadaceae bacterium]
MHFSKSFRRSGFFGVFILFLAALVFSAACGGSGASGQGNRRGGGAGGNSNSPAIPDAGPVVTVTATKVVAREVPAIIQSTGTLVANETSDVAPKIAGKVVNVSANVGQFVGQGDVIAKIDDRDARLRLAEAQAGVT